MLLSVVTKDLADVTKLGILRWGDCPEYLSGPSLCNECPHKKEAEGDWTTEE